VQGTTFGTGSVDDKREWVIETLISRFNLVVLNMGELTHVSVTSGNLSATEFAMCSPAISAYFM
jgi:hypothetical protein